MVYDASFRWVFRIGMSDALEFTYKHSPNQEVQSGNVSLYHEFLSCPII